MTYLEEIFTHQRETLTRLKNFDSSSRNFESYQSNFDHIMKIITKKIFDPLKINFVDKMQLTLAPPAYAQFSDEVSVQLPFYKPFHNDKSISSHHCPCAYFSYAISDSVDSIN